MTLLALLALLPMHLFAQPFTIRPLGLKDGLSCNYVVSMAQDKYGFLWFATEEGLNRFDGERFFTYYKRKNQPGISSSELNCVLDDAKMPVLWVGTKNDGLNSFNYQTEEWHCYKHDDKDASSLATNDITDLSLAADGNLWITTYWKGVEYLNTQTGRFTHYDSEHVKGMPDNQLWCVLDVGNGIILAGHVRAGLTVIDTRHRTARNFQHSDTNPTSLSGNTVNCLYKDRNGVIWVGTSAGVDIYDALNQRFIHVAEEQIQHHQVFDFCEMPDGRMFVATEQKGIAILDVAHKLFPASNQVPCSFIQEGDGENCLSGNSIRCLMLDKYNNVWAGLYGSGVNFLTTVRPPFENITYGPAFQTDKLTERSVMALAFDNLGQLWAGTDGNGLNVFSPTKERIATYPKELSNTVQTALKDKDGNLWFGTYSNGAYVKSVSSAGFRQVLPTGKEDVRCLFQDERGLLWMGTSSGIYVLDTHTLQVVKTYHLGNDQVRAITMDAQHRLWVGYFGVGIEVYSPQMKLLAAFNTYTGQPGAVGRSASDDNQSVPMPSNAVNHLFCDSRHRVWAATNEGAVCFDASDFRRFMVYDLQTGLNNEHVRAIIEDEMHNIWMSTNRGLSCVPHHNPHQVLNFNEKDNVALANFNDGCVVRSKQGIIYFGSADGICYFKPKTVLAKTKAPRVFVTSLNIIQGLEKNDSIINLANKKEISLAYNENTFSLSFNVQNYALEKYVEYSYKLKGMQDEWMTTSNGVITLRDVPAGTYLLQVRSRLHNQPWSDDLTEFTITVNPPFWLSWWAKLFYLCLVVALACAGLRVYKRHLRLEYLLKAEKINHEKEQKLNEERLRFFTNITHELRTPLTLILGPLDDISHSSDISKAVKHKLAIIHQSAVRLNELITQILEFRKTETDNRQLRVVKGNIVDAVHEISLKYEELAQKPDVVIKFVAPENPIDMYFDREVIAIIVDNLISNAIKYTDHGNIDVSVERRRSGERHLVDINVSDTGHGISQQALPHVFDRYYQENGSHQASGTGIGLSLVKKLVELHQGEIKAESSVEQGTSFIVTLDEQEIYPQALRGSQPADKKDVWEGDMPTDVSESQAPQDSVALGEAVDKTKGKPSLLIVEDNKEILDYVADSFEDEFEVKKASDGRQGLAIALDVVPDVIISDIMMPQMDGNEMCRALKNDVRTSHIPIILLTAKDSLEAKEEGYESGADSYITKPFTHSLLRTRIHNLLLQRRRSKLQIQEAKDTDLAEKKQQLRESLNRVDQEFFDKLNKLIEDNISGDIDVNMLADNLAVSTSTLYRKMKALTGISTVEYIRKYKMQYAEHLLLEGKYSISEISFMVGMNSVAYFRRCFKMEYGMIPSEYLKKLKSEGSF